MVTAPYILHIGDCVDVLKSLPDNSVDAVVTDPPYGLSNTKPAQVADVLKAWVTGDDSVVPEGKGFMGKSWDGFVPPPAVWKECLRVLKPGGHMAVFAGARTQDLMGLSIRLAGFDIRDGLSWITGSGFPKGQDVGKAIDKMKGAKREEFVNPRWADKYPNGNGGNHNRGKGGIYGETESVLGRKLTTSAPATDEARRWDGWNTQLKPAQEPIILARKPLDGTVAANVLAHGVGGLNIDACRVGTSGGGTHCNNRDSSGKCLGHGDAGKSQSGATFHAAEVEGSAGRFPANVLLDEHAAAEMDKQSGITKDGTAVKRNRKNSEANRNGIYGSHVREAGPDQTFGSSGGASRFFPVFKYQAKAPKKERPVIEREDGTKVQHPTVKPAALMEWLCTLITPPGGTVLDPFAGSGTTLQAARDNGFHAIGIEQDPDYAQLVHQRMSTTDEGEIAA